MIYFLRRADGAIKIGTTKKYYTRRSDLTKKYGGLELLGIMEGDRAKEQEIHQRFSHSRLNNKHETEWFQPCQELLAFIAENASSEVHTARDVTIKVSDRTHLLLKSFQAEQFAITGKRLTNDEVITLAIRMASPKAAEWAEDFLARNSQESANIVAPDKR